jgi:hypothetical protein
VTCGILPQGRAALDRVRPRILSSPTKAMVHERGRDAGAVVWAPFKCVWIVAACAIACGASTKGGSQDEPSSSAGTGGLTGKGGSQDEPRAGTEAGGTTAGTSADGGASGGHQLGDACASLGALSCAGNQQKLKLVCGAKGSWESNGTCETGEFCQTSAGPDLGICLAVVPECAEVSPGSKICKNGAVLQCGPDLVDTTLVEECTLGCEGGTCRTEPLCETGKANCDATPDCETDIVNSAKHCGICNNACIGLANATGYCAEGKCSCSAGYSDCDATAGCETASSTDPNNCGECGHVCASGECVSGECTSRVFVTSQGFSGDLGGLAGADAKCQASASSAGIEGSFKAWLSDTKTHVSTRLPHSAAPYRLLNDNVVADNWAGLSNIEQSISVDETGDSLIYQTWVWTGEGEPEPSNDEYYCRDWTSGKAGDVGFVGQALGTGAYWNVSAWRDCEVEQARLFCFEVDAR